MRRRPLLAFFAFVYGVSLVALVVIGLPSLHPAAPSSSTPLIMFPVMVVSVGVAGVVLTGVVAGGSAARQFLRGTGGWRVRSTYYLALLIPPACILTVLVVFHVAVAPAFRPAFFPIGLTFGVVAGFFEEFGWSGFAYPRMRARQGNLTGAVVLGLLWGLWHLPVVDSLGAASPHGESLPLFFLAFVLVLTSLRVLIAWIYLRTGSLFMAQTMHASSTGFLVVLGAQQVSASQEALWYASYGALLGLVALALWLRVPANGTMESAATACT